MCLDAAEDGGLGSLCGSYGGHFFPEKSGADSAAPRSMV
jgi:hypothetical protein